MTPRFAFVPVVLVAAGACTSYELLPQAGTTEASSSSTAATGVDEAGTTTRDATEGTGAAQTDGTTGGSCTFSAECFDEASPICAGTTCSPCADDSECAAKDPGAPTCRRDGRCVECTPDDLSSCGGSTPVCNPGSGSCEGCRFHEQCAGTACDIESGACFVEACVVEVDGDGGADYQTIADAVPNGCVVVVHERDGGQAYHEALRFDGATMALVAASGEQPLLVGAGGNPAVEVIGATLYMEGLTLRGDSEAEGVVADDGRVYLDRMRVKGTFAGAMRIENDGLAQVRNSFVGGDVNDVPALEVTGSRVDVVYSTLGAGFGDAVALRCDPASTVSVRNSLLVARSSAPAIECATEILENSATEADAGEVNTNWFVPNGYANGDFHLGALAPLAILIAAQWRDGDPSSDIDGEPRIAEDGMVGPAGADVP